MLPPSLLRVSCKCDIDPRKAAAQRVFRAAAFCWRDHFGTASTCLQPGKMRLNSALKLAIGTGELRTGWRIGVDNIEQVNPIIPAIMPPFGL